MLQAAPPGAAARPQLRVIDGGRDGLLTVRDVAAQLGVCTATVYALCARGELGHLRVMNAVRVSDTQLAEFIAGARR
ncbi:MAG: helix-turn-helix domain-containing protein [Gaiellaceae bacterium]